MSGDGLAHIPGKLPELLDKINGEGPNFTNEESERILKGLADAAREQDSRDLIIESYLVFDRDVFWLLFEVFSWPYVWTLPSSHLMPSGDFMSS